MLKLVSQEMEKVPVPKKVAMMSELVKTMAEGDKEEKEIPLPNVKSAVLNKVHHHHPSTYHHPSAPAHAYSLGTFCAFAAARLPPSPPPAHSCVVLLVRW